MITNTSSKEKVVGRVKTCPNCQISGVKVKIDLKLAGF